MLRGNSLDPFFRIMWTNERRVGEPCTWQAATGWSGAIRMVCRMCSTSFFGFHSASHSTIEKPWHAAIAKVLHFRITCAQLLGVPRGVCIMRSWLAGIAPAMTRYGVGSPGSQSNARRSGHAHKLSCRAYTMALCTLGCRTMHPHTPMANACVGRTTFLNDGKRLLLLHLLASDNKMQTRSTCFVVKPSDRFTLSSCGPAGVRCASARRRRCSTRADVRTCTQHGGQSGRLTGAISEPCGVGPDEAQ